MVAADRSSDRWVFGAVHQGHDLAPRRPGSSALAIVASYGLAFPTASQFNYPSSSPIGYRDGQFGAAGMLAAMRAGRALPLPVAELPALSYRAII